MFEHIVAFPANTNASKTYGTMDCCSVGRTFGAAQSLAQLLRENFPSGFFQYSADFLQARETFNRQFQ